MPHLFFLDSSRTSSELLDDELVLADEIVGLIGFETDEEYLVLSGVIRSLISQEGVNNPLGSVSVFSEVDEEGKEFAYLEVGLNEEAVSQLSPGILARFDQYTTETFEQI